jgi:hypothetical protein
MIVWAVPASRSAAVTALEMVSGGEDHVGAFVVKIFGFKRRLLYFALARRILTHFSILS